MHRLPRYGRLLWQSERELNPALGIEFELLDDRRLAVNGNSLHVCDDTAELDPCSLRWASSWPDVLVDCACLHDAHPETIGPTRNRDLDGSHGYI